MVPGGLGGAGVLLVLCAIAWTGPVPLGAQEEDRLEDLRRRAVAVRSVDPADEDFSDLAPLAEAIGDARIVQLGESSHGAGTTFAAKVRLVKFLHRELGFDVLLWESGMWDLRTVDDALRAGVDPAEAAPLGVFTIWSRSEEVLPLFEYARTSHDGDDPLEMAGFDMQFSGSRSTERFLDDLVRFFGEVEDPHVRDAGSDLAERMMGAFDDFTAVWEARAEYVRELRTAGVTDAVGDSLEAWQATRQASFEPTEEELGAFREAAEGLLDIFGTGREALVAAHGEREVDFMERVVGNTRLFGETQYERNAAGRPTEGPEAMAVRNRGWNRRDTRMAENIRWLAEERYPDRKLIVWAHNGHIMNAYYESDWSALSHEPTEEGMKPMGVFSAEEMGRSVYTLGFTAYEGEHGMVTMDRTFPIEAAPEGSFEALLHRLDPDHLFVDFRGLPADHWLRDSATMAIRGYGPEVMEDWTRVVDGMFFIDRMRPATRIER